jgi:hypothetical protein
MEMMTSGITCYGRKKWELDITTVETIEILQSVSFDGQIVTLDHERMRTWHNHHGTHKVSHSKTKQWIRLESIFYPWIPSFNEFPTKMVSALSGSYYTTKFSMWISDSIYAIMWPNLNASHYLWDPTKRVVNNSFFLILVPCVFPIKQYKQILYSPLTSPQQWCQNDEIIYYPLKNNKRDCAFTYKPRVIEKLARCRALYVYTLGYLFTLFSYHASYMGRKLHYYLGNETTLQKINHTTLAKK